MKKVEVRLGMAEEFFERGREVGRLADVEAAIPEMSLITVEDPEDLFEVVPADGDVPPG